MRFRDKKVHDCNGRVGEAKKERKIATSRWKKNFRVETEALMKVTALLAEIRIEIKLISGGERSPDIRKEKAPSTDKFEDKSND